MELVRWRDAEVGMLVGKSWTNTRAPASAHRTAHSHTHLLSALPPSRLSLMEQDMASVFSRKAALRKGMLRTLRQIPEDSLASQCNLNRKGR